MEKNPNNIAWLIASPSLTMLTVIVICKPVSCVLQNPEMRRLLQNQTKKDRIELRRRTHREGLFGGLDSQTQTVAKSRERVNMPVSGTRRASARPYLDLKLAVQSTAPTQP
jgi:hypothetical protein